MNENNFESKKVCFRDVDASFSHGQIYSGKLWDAFLILLFVLFGVLFLSAILMMCLGDEEEYTCGIYIMAFCAVVLLVFVFLFAYIFYGRKKVSIYLKDAVVLKAKSVLADTDWNTGRYGFPFRTSAIKVKFKYDGKVYNKLSTYKGYTSYLAIYNKYADREILIAYSPKYDEVMILKDKQN